MALDDILHVTDVLDKNQMKPWWEKIRTATSTLLIASSLYTIYGCAKVELQCQHTNITQGFQSSHVNEICSRDQQVFWLVNFWWFSLAACSVMFVAHNWWELMPSVASSVKLYRKVHDLMEICRIKQDVITENGTPGHPCSFENNETFLFEIQQLRSLIKYNERMLKNIVPCYFIRNIWAVIVSAAYGSLVVCILYQQLNLALRWDCIDGVQTYSCATFNKQCVLPILFLHSFIAILHVVGFVKVTMKVWKMDNNYDLLHYLHKSAGEVTSTNLPEIQLMGETMKFEDVLKNMLRKRRNPAGSEETQQFSFYLWLRNFVGSELPASLDIEQNGLEENSDNPSSSSQTNHVVDENETNEQNQLLEPSSTPKKTK